MEIEQEALRYAEVTYDLATEIKNKGLQSAVAELRQGAVDLDVAINLPPADATETKSSTNVFLRVLQRIGGITKKKPQLVRLSLCLQKSTGPGFEQASYANAVAHGMANLEGTQLENLIPPDVIARLKDELAAPPKTTAEGRWTVNGFDVEAAAKENERRMGSYYVVKFARKTNADGIASCHCSWLMG